MAAAPPLQTAAYRLVVSDELGTLKVVEVPAGPKWDAAAVVSQWGAADKSAAVQSLACSATSLQPGTAAVIAVGRKGGKVQVLDAATGEQQGSFTAGPAAAAAGKVKSGSSTNVIALEFIAAAESRPLQLVAATSDGTVSICTCSSSSGDASTDPSSSSSWIVSRSFAVGPTLSCLAVDSTGTHIAVGGEGMQPSLWDLSTGSKVWQGKGGKPNRIGLVDKPFPTAVAFLPSSETEPPSGTAAAAAAAAAAGAAGNSGDSSSISRRFVVGSATAKVHVYDTAAGKRPQQEAVFGESRITALEVPPNGQHVWVANGTGHMQLWILQTNKLMVALKGAGGSVRTLALYPGPEPWLASVGLDRFLRIHDTTTRAAKARVYLKQQLTSVVWVPVLQPPAAAAGVAAAGTEAAVDAVVDAGQRSSSKKKKKHRSKDSKQHSSANGVGEGDGAEAQQSKKRQKQAA